MEKRSVAKNEEETKKEEKKRWTKIQEDVRGKRAEKRSGKCREVKWRKGGWKEIKEGRGKVREKEEVIGNERNGKRTEEKKTEEERD